MRIWDAIGSSPVGEYMISNTAAFPAVETVHVMAITTVVGMIAILDLRLLGLAARDYPFTRLTRVVLPATWLAFALAVASGLLLFSSQPGAYAENSAFEIKMALILAAGLNMAFFHLFTSRGVKLWDRDAPVPAAARTAGLLSLLIWVLVVAFARWVGFSMTPF